MNNSGQRGLHKKSCYIMSLIPNQTSSQKVWNLCEILDFRFQILDFGFQIFDFGFWGVQGMYR